MTFRLALDLATKQIGYAIFENQKEQPKDVRIFKGCGVIKLLPWDNTREYFLKLNSKISEFVENVLKKYGNGWWMELAIELANFSNPLQTQRMSFIAGAFVQKLLDSFLPLKIKIYNANGWYKHFNNEFEKTKNWTQLPREKRKELSIKYFEQNHTIKDWDKMSDVDKSDIADAYWIGYFFDKVEIN